jgi:hypothetical protein
MPFKVSLSRQFRYNLRGRKSSPLLFEKHPQFFPQSLVKNLVVPCCTDLFLDIENSENASLDGEIFIFTSHDHIFPPCTESSHSSYYMHFGMKRSTEVRKDFGARICGRKLNNVVIKLETFHSYRLSLIRDQCRCLVFLYIVGKLNGEEINERIAMRIVNETGHIKANNFCWYTADVTYPKCEITSCHFLNKSYNLWRKQIRDGDNLVRQLQYLYSN